MIEIKSESPGTDDRTEKGEKDGTNPAENGKEDDRDDLNNNERSESVHVKTEQEEREREEGGNGEERVGSGMNPMETATLLLLSRIALFNKVRAYYLRYPN